ncbi:MAG: hypothetical protein QOE63_2043 [Acidimicrobiaceae bacterium]
MKPRTVVLLAVLSALGPLFATVAVGARPFGLSGVTHCIGVGVGAAFATLAAYAVAAVGVRRGDARTVLVAVAFAAMGAILAVHGLVTPGVLVENTNLSPITGGATVPVGAAILALGAVPGFAVPARIPLLLRTSVVITILVLAASGLGIVDPSLVPAVPAARSTGAIALLILGGACLTLVVVRASRTWLLTRRSADLAVVVGVAWLGAALVGATLFRYDQLGWWLGHGFEIVAIAIVGATVAFDLRRTAASRPLTGDLPATALVRDAEAFLGARVNSLLLDLRDADRSTGEHTRRVALNAVLVGEALGLSRGRLRGLALGGLLHDIGKLGVPVPILQKPGALDPAERKAIERHPALGAAMLDQLGGFGRDVRSLVLDHHERPDGDGYPRGLANDELSLDARIMAVCDVFDALVSDRPYRAAWPVEQALETLREGAGTQFDARCVQALTDIVQPSRREEAA